MLGGVYGAAMALVYGVLGVVVIMTASTFGTINASPWFNLGIAIVFVVLALAMFDVLTIDFSRFSSGFGVERIETRIISSLAFGMGAIAALLAGACVAPVVIQVVCFRAICMRGNGRGARVAVSARHRHGGAVADRRSRHRGPAEAGRLDGEGQAGLRRLHPRHGRSTTAISRMACSPIGG